ncbi:ABC transporter substrate-binding protein [Hoyosella subflava]|uniref:Putative ABC transporter substrate-binding protein n=1 Tax=Hoyosella subflava (strain DSM 45089 / JCM 17490 / NBRC 109087 / DQS3-9A1) TaxID=443218 RepID=F6EGN5_HOYSD|nr:ABC transporter substrate-binding protein [Hoyosella subflava]AEF42273.1 Putative ABC transporter substrate-binding protein [Hoyosella subflava DQS3-9A1]
MTPRLSRRAFLGAFMCASGAALIACGGEEEGDSGAASTATVTTPLGTVTVPRDPQRVVAVDSRQDLEIALALGLPVAGYTSPIIRPWVPLRGDPESLRSPVNVVELVRIDPDLIICTNIESPFWLTPELSSVAPVLPVDPRAPWQTNLATIGGWLGRKDVADAAIKNYQDRIERVRSRHGENLRESVAVVGIATDGTISDLSHTPTIPGVTVEDLGAPVVRFTTEPEASADPDAAAAALTEADRILVSSDDPELEPDYLVDHPFLGQLPAVRTGRATVTADVSYGSVYTALETVALFDELLRR